ncbi:Thermolabile glutaminase [Serratia marcescens]|uniref:glutaminase n=1 Tax=Serratia marcescens TaxID=615 RepID=A0A379YJ75_SERMA|nr:Thermolabile glutaminase [Serratia marcescens]
MVTTLDNALLEEILQQVRPLIGQGKVADYIPALAEVPADRLAIAVCTVDGELFQAGDAAERFSIQSISKVLSLTLALTRYQEPEIWRRVGKEPSGLPFNSLLQLEMEQGKPRNPFINPRRAGGVRHAANPAQRPQTAHAGGGASVGRRRRPGL